MLFDGLFTIFGWGAVMIFGPLIIRKAIQKPKVVLPIIFITLILLAGLAIERKWMDPELEAASIIELSSSAAEKMDRATDNLIELADKLRAEKGILL